MVELTLNKLERQIIIFLGLSVVNIVFAAIALAIGIVFVINYLLPMVNTGMVNGISIGYIIGGGCLAIIGFWWILPSTSIMDFITDLQFDSYKKKEVSIDEKEIGLIIRLLSYYRENDKIFSRLIFISQLGGAFFLINGIITTFDIFSNMDTSFSLELYMMQIVAIILMFGWGIISSILPLFIRQITKTWQNRVDKSKEAEEILRNHLEK